MKTEGYGADEVKQRYFEIWNAAHRVTAMIFPMNRFTERGQLYPLESQPRNSRTWLSALLPTSSRPRCTSQFGFQNFS